MQTSWPWMYQGPDNHRRDNRTGPRKRSQVYKYIVQVGEQVGKKPPWKAGRTRVHRLQGWSLGSHTIVFTRLFKQIFKDKIIIMIGKVSSESCPMFRTFLIVAFWTYTGYKPMSRLSHLSDTWEVSKRHLVPQTVLLHPLIWWEQTSSRCCQGWKQGEALKKRLE